MAISDEITRIQNAKSQIKTAIENKGVTVPEGTTLDGYSPLIDEIKTQGKYQSKSVVPSKSEQSIQPDEGYDALSMVFVDRTPLEEKTVEPTTGGLIVEPEGENVGLSKVTVMGDHNLTSSNIKNGVTIFGVTGTFEGSGGGSGTTSDLSSVGSEISVEARTTIDKGDRIVGIKNGDYVTPTVSSSSASVTLANLSRDMTVGIGSATVTSNSILPIHFLNDVGTYDTYNLELGDISEITTSTFASSNMLINDDGSLIAYGGTKILVIKTDKDTKTASYKIVGHGDIDNKSIIINSGNYEITSYHPIVSKNNSALAGEYLLANVNMVTTYSDSTTYKTFAILKYNGSSFSFVYYLREVNTTHAFKTALMYDEDNILGLCARTYQKVHSVVKYNISSNTINYANRTASSTTAVSELGGFSNNGKYLIIFNYLYELNITDMTFSLVKQMSYYNNGFPNSDGTLVISGGKIYNTTSTTAVYSGLQNPINQFFDLKRWVGSTNIYSITPSTEAEYLISSIFTFEMVADRIYGIADKAMTVGMQGTARGLFNTF